MGYRFLNACETLALQVLTTFCYQHHDVITASPFGLFPPTKDDDQDWLSRFHGANDVVAANPKGAVQVRYMRALLKLHNLMA